MAKTSKTPKAPKSFKSYALNKCLIGYGVVNGIINAAIFAGINAGAPDAMFGMHDIVHDLAFTGLLLGMLLFACVVPLTRMDLRKGVFSLPGAAGGAFPLVSSSYAVSILGVGALAAVVMTGAGALLSLALPAAGATVTGMMFLKGVRFGRRGRRLVHHQLCGARPAEGRRGGGRHGLQDCRGSALGQSAWICACARRDRSCERPFPAGALCFERGAGAACRNRSGTNRWLAYGKVAPKVPPCPPFRNGIPGFRRWHQRDAHNEARRATSASCASRRRSR